MLRIVSPILAAVLAWVVLPAADAHAVTGGDELLRFSRPAVVSLQSVGRHVCGGTLISSTTVLTSASCTSSRNLQVRAHVHDLSRSDAEENRSTTKVKTVHQHPDFDAATRLNDIAVLVLEGTVPNAQPATLPAAGSVTPQGTELLLAGWGATTQDGPLSPVLNSVNVATGDPAACAAAYELDGPGVLCVPPDEGKGACTGDTGGPAFTGRVLRAIQTVPGCGRPGQPTALTAVSHYQEFINRWTTR
ncbi:serine protease [Streptomyces rochei]|uniref:serine protease n=1 Tax=Streptomyces rochei TaxID=1928 RepID=UPI00363870ED